MSWRRALPWLLVFALLAAGGGYGLPSLGGGDDGPARCRLPAHASRASWTATRSRSRSAAGPRRVRYIGVDTPESVKPGTPVQCFAKAASHFNERLVDGQRVRLRFDAERRDRYGRLLAYVYRARDGLFVNAELVRRRLRGHADDPAQRRARRRVRRAGAQGARGRARPVACLPIAGSGARAVIAGWRW